MNSVEWAMSLLDIEISHGISWKNKWENKSKSCLFIVYFKIVMSELFIRFKEKITNNKKVLPNNDIDSEKNTNKY